MARGEGLHEGEGGEGLEENMIKGATRDRQHTIGL